MSATPGLPLLLMLIAARTGFGIRCYSTLCSSVTVDTDRCAFRRDTARLETCRYEELLETHVRVEVGELSPAQTFRDVRDEDMRCIYVQSTVVWGSGVRKVDYRACMPPDPLRCQILHNGTLRRYEGLYGRHSVRVHWNCFMCDTDGCNSGEEAPSGGLASPAPGAPPPPPPPLLQLLLLAACAGALVT